MCPACMASAGVVMGSVFSTGGLTALYLVVRTTFSGDELTRSASVRLFGLRAPLGAFLCGADAGPGNHLLGLQLLGRGRLPR